MIQRIVIALICLLLATGPVEAQQRTTAAPEESAHPLQPLDTSSPRAALTGFLNNSDAISRFYRDVYYDNPTFANLRAIFEARLRTARRVLDLSYIAPATRDQVAVDSSVYLYETPVPHRSAGPERNPRAGRGRQRVSSDALDRARHQHHAGARHGG